MHSQSYSFDDKLTGVYHFTWNVANRLCQPVCSFGKSGKKREICANEIKVKSWIILRQVICEPKMRVSFNEWNVFVWKLCCCCLFYFCSKRKKVAALNRKSQRCGISNNNNDESVQWIYVRGNCVFVARHPNDLTNVWFRRITFQPKRSNIMPTIIDKNMERKSS